MKRFFALFTTLFFLFVFTAHAAVELDGDANGLVDVSKGGLNALPTADTQLLQATGVGTFGWASVIDDTKGNGHTEYLWSADKVFDQLALKQGLDADLTTWAGVTPSANGQSLVSAANYAAMKALLDLEAGTDFNAYDADLADLADGSLTASKVAGSKVATASKAADYTIGTDSADEVYGGTVYVSGAATITAPVVAAGMNFTVVTIGAVAVSLDVNAADRMYLNGTALADGDKATNNSTTGDTLQCQYESADGWYCRSVAGTWIDGN